MTKICSHPFLQLNSHIPCMSTFVELRRLHHRFMHPSMNKPDDGVERSEMKDVQHETRRVLSSTERSGDPCQIYTQNLPRLKLTLRVDKGFSHSVCSDIICIGAKTTLQVSGEAAYFQASRWSNYMYFETPRNALRMANLIGAVFQPNAEMLHTWTKSIPVDAAIDMRDAQCYHSLIRRSFNIIWSKSP